MLTSTFVLKNFCSAFYSLFPAQPTCAVNSPFFMKTSILDQYHIPLNSNFVNHAQAQGMFSIDFVLIILYLLAISFMTTFVSFGIKQCFVLEKSTETLYEDFDEPKENDNLITKLSTNRNDLKNQYQDPFVKNIVIQSAFKNKLLKSSRNNFTSLQSGILQTTAVYHFARIVEPIVLEPPDSIKSSPILNLLLQESRNILNLTKLTEHQLARRNVYKYSYSLHEAQQYISSPFSNKFASFKKIEELNYTERTLLPKLFNGGDGSGYLSKIASDQEMKTQYFYSSYNPFNNAIDQMNSFTNKLFQRVSS